MSYQRKFLLESMTEERAKALTDELGFLGICDLVHYLAPQTHGSLEMVSPLAIVKIRKRPRPKKGSKS